MTPCAMYIRHVIPWLHTLGLIHTAIIFDSERPAITVSAEFHVGYFNLACQNTTLTDLQ